MRRTIRVCDLHDDIVPAVETVTVRLQGRSHALDACEEHTRLFRSLPAVADDHAVAGGPAPLPAGSAPRPPTSGRSAAGRTVTTGRGGADAAVSAAGSAGPKPGSRRSLQRERAAVREWARRNGRDVGDKGRLPSGLVDEYRREQAASG